MDEFETLKDVVAAGREREGTALDIERRPAPYSYNKVSTNVWKAGNLLGHYGVHAVGELAVAVGPKVPDGAAPERARGRIDAVEPLLAALGGTTLGAVVDLTPSEPVDAPVVVTPAHWELAATPGCRRMAYGGPPTDPDVTHFERSVWSENPIEPPEPVEATDAALRFAGETWSHAELLEAVAEVVADRGLGADSKVLLDAPITQPGGFLAGVLAPLAVGATIVVPDGEPSEETAGTLVVSENAAGNALDPGDVTRLLRDTRSG